MRIFRDYKIIFTAYIIFFACLILGYIPREASLWAGVILIIWALISPLEEAALFFVAAIPMMVALPITDTFDSLNVWRPLSALIFIKYILRPVILRKIVQIIKQVITRPLHWIGKYKLGIAIFLMLILSIISVIWSPNKEEAVMRVAYFVNLSLIGFVVYRLVIESDEFSRRLLRSIVASLIIVGTVGILQVISTYFIDIYQFMRLWGENIQCQQFGNQWCYIAVNVGNTWFAYYGEQLSLRVFSLFPDSHSFPVYSLLALPALFSLSIVRSYGLRFWQALRTRMSLWVITIPIIFLIIILSGTRGIWAASIGVPFLALILALLARKWQMPRESSLIGYIGSYMAIFFVLFMLAFPIFSSPQFLLSKDDNDILRHRIRSIIDFGETSNSQRLEIWKKTLEYIKKEPLTGIGLGNYPFVLDQKIELAKAGSSAHNIYLQVMAELGIAGLVLLIYIFWKIFNYAWLGIKRATIPSMAVYCAAMLLFLPWIYAYLMTDPILFDERVFLLFAVSTGLITARAVKIYEHA